MVVNKQKENDQPKVHWRLGSSTSLLLWVNQDFSVAMVPINLMALPS
jgi:hypothetical protein